MNILINASNLAYSGGAQVANSICNHLENINHHFVVILSPTLQRTFEQIKNFNNTEATIYKMPRLQILSMYNGRNKFLDNIVDKHKIDCVLTIFGPMRWNPKCPHLCGFAIPHIAIPESPFFKQLSLKNWIKFQMKTTEWLFIFRKGAKNIYTENPYISDKVKKLIPEAKVFTVTNYYNQVYDCLDKQKTHQLPVFNGKQFLYIGSNGEHKNLKIMIPISQYLYDNHPDFNFRFVITVNENDFFAIPEHLKKHFLLIGRVDVSECPSLYRQCDIAFQPSLLECFSAVYAESMRMERPIVTTNLKFATGLCGNAALYYDPLNPISAAECLYKVSNDNELYVKLVKQGKNELEKFDNNKERVDKLISICEKISNNKKCNA